MTNYKRFKENVLANPEVKSEYDSLQNENDLIQVKIDARNNQNMTQKELSEITGASTDK